jgi:hypothetical protein
MKEALRLALEALEIEEAQTHYPSQWLLKAITAIKAALAQQAQQPLTDAELDALYDKIAKYQEYGAAVSGWYDFARAIEAAHGIKENT